MIPTHLATSPILSDGAALMESQLKRNSAERVRSLDPSASAQALPPNEAPSSSSSVKKRRKRRRKSQLDSLKRDDDDDDMNTSEDEDMFPIDMSSDEDMDALDSSRYARIRGGTRRRTGQVTVFINSSPQNFLFFCGCILRLNFRILWTQS